jgi:hypothetical protein
MFQFLPNTSLRIAVSACKGPAVREPLSIDEAETIRHFLHITTGTNSGLQ